MVFGNQGMSELKNSDNVEKFSPENLIKKDGNIEIPECLPENSLIEVDGKPCLTDDYGAIYERDGILEPSQQFVLDGKIYQTNDLGEIVFGGELPQYNNPYPVGRLEMPVAHANQSDVLNTKDFNTRLPENNGSWDGERGNSTWHPDPEYVPPEKSKSPETSPYSNPDNLSWKEILDKYGIDGIKFRDGFPVFDDISKGTVEIDGFETGGSDAKNRNFKRADIAMAEQRGCTPEEVKKWREENNYTWHECEDKKTMQKVPNEVHANVPHDGGRSQQ